MALKDTLATYARAPTGAAGTGIKNDFAAVADAVDGKATSAQGAKADTAHGWGDHASAGYEPTFTKNTAFNKDFGSTAGTVCQGNDARLSDARPPTAHTHGKAEITDFSDGDYATAAQGALADTALQSFTETDPVFTAWDKSTGITINESQISDLGSYLTSVTSGDVDSGAAGNGQVLTANGSGGTSWTSVGAGSVAWGSIAGTLSNQTDLNDALAGKAAATHTHVKSDITDFSDGDYATAAQGVLADSALQPDGVLKESLNTETTSGNITLNLTNGMTQRLTLGGNHQITMPADPGAFGQVFQLLIDCAGNTPTWAANPVIKWLTIDQAAPTLETTTAAVNVIVFTWDDVYNGGAGAWLGQHAGYAEAP